MTIKVTGKNVDDGDAYHEPTSPKRSRMCSANTSVLTSPAMCGWRRNAASSGRPARYGSGAGSCSRPRRRRRCLFERGCRGRAISKHRVRRHKRRLKSHHNGRETAQPAATLPPATTLCASTMMTTRQSQAGHPVIVAETERGISEMPVSEAVMQLDVTESPFLVFRNASHGELNIVYRRADGHIGWIDPKSGAGAGNAERRQRMRELGTPNISCELLH